MSERGKLITIEGIDGSGKTTLATALVRALAIRQVRAWLLREPGGVATSEVIRGLVKDPGFRVGDRTEALLYAAARAQLVEEVLEPSLRAGDWIVLDRFTDSSLAYQGGGRELGVDTVRALNLFGTGGLTPDRTLLLELPREFARERANSRGEPADRLEQEDDGFFTRVADTYRALAEAEPERIRALDASQPPSAVLTQAIAALDGLLPE